MVRPLLAELAGPSGELANGQPGPQFRPGLTELTVQESLHVEYLGV